MTTPSKPQDHFWPARPFDPDCTERVPQDDATVATVRRVLHDWDGENWIAVYHVLRALGYTPPELARMTVFDVRMALAVRQTQAFVTLGGRPETHSAGVIHVTSENGTAVGERWFPARHFEQNDISADTLRQAAHDGRIRKRKTNGSRNEYPESDVRRCWPHLFA